jgi:hypothetical protein
MFSIGAVIYTLLCGYEPFYGENESELIAANEAVEYDCQRHIVFVCVRACVIGSAQV